jgi:hypothetical protein
LETKNFCPSTRQGYLLLLCTEALASAVVDHRRRQRSRPIVATAAQGQGKRKGIIVARLEAYERRSQEQEEREPSSFVRDKLLPFLVPAVFLGSALYALIRVIAKVITR